MKYLLAVLALGCVPALQHYEAAVITLPEEVYPMQDHAARTLCALNNVPIIVIHPKLLGTLAEPITLSHERVHVRQMVSYPGGCRKAMEKYVSDAETRYKWEMEAYCTSINTASELGVDTEILTENIRKVLREQFDRPLICQNNKVLERMWGG